MGYPWSIFAKGSHQIRTSAILCYSYSLGYGHFLIFSLTCYLEGKFLLRVEIIRQEHNRDLAREMKLGIHFKLSLARKNCLKMQ